MAKTIGSTIESLLFERASIEIPSPLVQGWKLGFYAEKERYLFNTGLNCGLNTDSGRSSIDHRAIQPDNFGLCSDDGEKRDLLARQIYPTSYTRADVIVQDSGGVPTAYRVKDVLCHELPVIGTYVDPGIVPGFRYLVRRIGTDVYQFDGKALPLQTIGIGYGKRLTFKGKSANSNQNYFWSDSYAKGLAFNIQAISVGDRFLVTDTGNRPVAKAIIDWVDPVQIEKNSEAVRGKVRKWIACRASCTLTYNSYQHGMMSMRCSETGVKIAGTAYILKEPHLKEAIARRIEGIHLQSIGDCTFHADNGNV